MRRACDITLNGCPGADFPITNASSEAPDPLMFAGIGWTNFDPFRPPILGNGPAVEIDCTNITWSTVSQELADLLAQINSAFCQPPANPTNPDGSEIFPPPMPPDPNPEIPPFVWEPNTWTQPNPDLQQFQNDRQEASVNCPDGSVFTLAIEAGTATAMLAANVGPAWVEYINAFLLAYILQQLYDLRVCVTVPDLTNRTPPGIPPRPSPGPGTPATFSGFPGWCCVGQELDPGMNTYNISGGSPTAEWTFSLTAGSIPPDTLLVQTSPRSAVLQGFPSAPGNYSYTVTAVSGSSTITVNDTLNVFGLVNPSLPDPEVGTPYSQTIVAAGGVAPYTFAVSGSLPDGLSLSVDGILSGIPTTAGDTTFSIVITDSQGATCTSDPITVTTDAAPVLCFDWTDLNWPVPNVGHGGDGVSSFIPSSTQSDSFHATSNSSGSGGNFAFAQAQHATFTWNGPACNCQVQGTSLVSNNLVTCVLTVFRVSPLVFLLDVDFALIPSGPFTYNFSLPDCTSSPVAFKVGVATACGFVAGSTHAELQGTFSNI